MQVAASVGPPHKPTTALHYTAGGGRQPARIVETAQEQVQLFKCRAEGSGSSWIIASTAFLGMAQASQQYGVRSGLTARRYW